jgi:hypothetical protein
MDKKQQWLRGLSVSMAVFKWIGIVYVALGCMFMTISVDAPIGEKVIKPVIERQGKSQSDIGQGALAVGGLCFVVFYALKFAKRKVEGMD